MSVSVELEFPRRSWDIVVSSFLFFFFFKKKKILLLFAFANGMRDSQGIQR